MTDVVVIGSGAGGGPIAWRLASGGFRVTVLEKGPDYARADYIHDEALMRSTGDFFVPSVDDEPHIVVDHSRSAHAAIRSTVGWIACCVGGGTVHMGGTLYRFHPDDFQMRSRYGEFEQLADWPYGYSALEPYYSIAERVTGVSGEAHPHGNLGFRSQPYPMPPLHPHPLASLFDAACRQLGLDPVATPYAVNSVPYDGRPPCAYCDFCSGYGCPTGAKGSTQETFIARARRTSRCDVLPNAMATQILLDKQGRAVGCTYVDQSANEHRIHADLVVVSCSAVESARLLLLSRSASFPDGLANSTGLVGRNMQFHVGSAGRGRFTQQRHNDKCLDDRNPLLVRSLVDHYFIPAGVSSIPKGGVYRFDMDAPGPIQFASSIALRGERVLWGEELAARLRNSWCEARNVDFEVLHDFIPTSGTYVELDSNVTDKWGLPVARIHIDEPPHHKIVGDWLVHRGLEVLDMIGADQVQPLAVGYRNTVMTAGTCRAGTDPRTSVLDPFCRTHGVQNLFVVDGSFMPTSGGAPCTLTIIANSLRTADYILDRAATRAFG